VASNQFVSELVAGGNFLTAGRLGDRCHLNVVRRSSSSGPARPPTLTDVRAAPEAGSASLIAHSPWRTLFAVPEQICNAPPLRNHV